MNPLETYPWPTPKYLCGISFSLVVFAHVFLGLVLSAGFGLWAAAPSRQTSVTRDAIDHC